MIKKVPNPDTIKKFYNPIYGINKTYPNLPINPIPTTDNIFFKNPYQPNFLSYSFLYSNNYLAS